MKNSIVSHQTLGGIYIHRHERKCRWRREDRIKWRSQKRRLGRMAGKAGGKVSVWHSPWSSRAVERKCDWSGFCFLFWASLSHFSPPLLSILYSCHTFIYASMHLRVSSKRFLFILLPISLSSVCEMPVFLLIFQVLAPVEKPSLLLLGSFNIHSVDWADVCNVL